jgi:hypothetical protein
MAWELSASPTCLRNGPASTRCSGFRRASSPFELSLHRRRSPLPGNGISRAEKKASIPPPNHGSAVSETKRSYKKPANSGPFSTTNRQPVHYEATHGLAARWPHLIFGTHHQFNTSPWRIHTKIRPVRCFCFRVRPLMRLETAIHSIRGMSFTYNAEDKHACFDLHTAFKVPSHPPPFEVEPSPKAP